MPAEELSVIEFNRIERAILVAQRGRCKILRLPARLARLLLEGALHWRGKHVRASCSLKAMSEMQASIDFAYRHTNPCDGSIEFDVEADVELAAVLCEAAQRGMGAMTIGCGRFAGEDLLWP